MWPSSDVDNHNMMILKNVLWNVWSNMLLTYSHTYGHVLPFGFYKDSILNT